MVEEKEYLWAADSDDGLIELLLDSHENSREAAGTIGTSVKKTSKGVATFATKYYSNLGTKK